VSVPDTWVTSIPETWVTLWSCAVIGDGSEAARGGIDTNRPKLFCLTDQRESKAGLPHQRRVGISPF
jgi:hypothetical protein